MPPVFWVAPKDLQKQARASKKLGETLLTIEYIIQSTQDEVIKRKLNDVADTLVDIGEIFVSTVTSSAATATDVRPFSPSQTVNVVGEKGDDEK